MKTYFFRLFDQSITYDTERNRSLHCAWLFLVSALYGLPDVVYSDGPFTQTTRALEDNLAARLSRDA